MLIPKCISCLIEFICHKRTIFSQEIILCHRASAGSNEKKDTLGLPLCSKLASLVRKMEMATKSWLYSGYCVGQPAFDWFDPSTLAETSSDEMIRFETTKWFNQAFILYITILDTLQPHLFCNVRICEKKYKITAPYPLS